jgi:ribosomal protein S18 acetylase RimI-like enzyme
MATTNRVRIVDVTDEAAFALVPACADPGFDHRSCDYWEDADRGSKAARLDWIEVSAPPPARPTIAADNPFLADAAETSTNPFAPAGTSATANPFLSGDDPLADNPFAPARAARPTVETESPRKLRLLGRGLGVAGSYAKVLLVDDQPAAYCQFGPLTAYPRAQRTRELYPSLPDAPLPAVITCIATTREARGAGLGHRLIAAVVEELADRGFAAIEAYPEVGASADATSAATPAFWEAAGFARAADDERFPVMRRDLV